MTAPRPKVLIVDDDASFGGMVAEVEKGYDAVHLAEPERALERVAAGGRNKSLAVRRSFERPRSAV